MPRLRTPRNPPFNRRRFADEVITLCVHWYLRFNLSYRDVAEIAWEMGIERDGAVIQIAGLVITRQRPGTAKGFVFLTLEDETGVLNVIVNPGLLIANESPSVNGISIGGFPEQNHRFSHGIVVDALLQAQILFSLLPSTRPKQPDRMLPVIAGQFYELVEKVPLRTFGGMLVG
jgi:hypothetical protein